MVDFEQIQQNNVAYILIQTEILSEWEANIN